MAKIVESIDISRRPGDVFAYAADFSHFPEWQGGVVSVRREGTGKPSLARPRPSARLRSSPAAVPLWSCLPRSSPGGQAVRPPPSPHGPGTARAAQDRAPWSSGLP